MKRLVCLRCSQSHADKDALGEHLVDVHGVAPADALVESGIQQRPVPAPRPEDFVSPIVCTLCHRRGHNRRTCTPERVATPPQEDPSVPKQKKVLALPPSKPRTDLVIRTMPVRLPPKTVAVVPATAEDPVRAAAQALAVALERRMERDARLKDVLTEVLA